MARAAPQRRQVAAAAGSSVRCRFWTFVVLLAFSAISLPYVLFFGTPAHAVESKPSSVHQAALHVAFPIPRGGAHLEGADGGAAAVSSAIGGTIGLRAPANAEVDSFRGSPGNGAVDSFGAFVHDMDVAKGEDKCNLFTLWEFRNRVPEYAATNLQSWDRHAHGLCKEPILINDTNVRKYIPDMPEEYFRIEYDAAKSDMIRYALLYHNGGIYMDADFLMAKDFRDLITRLHRYDLVSYTVPGQDCERRGSFSSNFMGGRKGSLVHKAVWEAQKRALTEHCRPEEMKLEKVCCLDDASVKCHIPWTQLGEGISHRVLKQLIDRDREKQELRLFCFKDRESFVPNDITYVFETFPTLKQATEYWSKRREPQPFGRMAYHLFNSNSGVSNLDRTQLFDKTTVLGQLYTLSFSRLQKPDDEPSSLQLIAADAPVGLNQRLFKVLEPIISAKDCGGLLGGEVPAASYAAAGAASSTSWCRLVVEDDTKRVGDPTLLIYRRPSRQGSLVAPDDGVKRLPKEFIVEPLECCDGGHGRDVDLGDDNEELCQGLREDAAAAVAAGHAAKGAAGADVPLRRALAKRSPWGALVNIQLEGEEWVALGCLSDGELRQIRLLELRAGLCAGLSSGPNSNFPAMERRLRVLERLNEFFGLVSTGGDADKDPRIQGLSGLTCGAQTFAKRRSGGKDEFPALRLSYVATERLREAREKSSELADRIELALRPSVSPDDCGGIDDEASDGDGGLHSWCSNVLSKAASTGDAPRGLSYGIATWDNWSKRLSNSYKIKCSLYDCFATPQNSGDTPSLENFAVPPERLDICIDGKEHEDSQGRRFERLSEHLRARGPTGTLLKLDVEGYEWAALADVSDEELEKVDLFDLQIYFCNGLPLAPEDKAELRRRVEVLERLSRIFAVVERAPRVSERFHGHTDDSICSRRGDYPDVISVSYVNKERLDEVSPHA